MLTCSICNKSKEDLLAFSCVHSFCSACVHLDLILNFEELKNSQGVDNEIDLKCIICDGGQLKATKESLKEFLQKTPQGDGELSDKTCKEHNLDLKMFCITCSKSMCYSCFSIHEHNHVFTKDLNSTRKNCVKCKDYELLFHCIQCAVDCCYVCERISHRDHELTKIKDYYEKCKGNIKYTLLPAEHYEDFYNKLNLEETNMLDRFGVIRQNINKKIDEITKSLEKSKEEINSNFEMKQKEIKTSNFIGSNIFKKFYNDIENISSEDYKSFQLLSRLPDKFTSFDWNEKNISSNEKYSEQICEAYDVLKNHILKIQKINENFKTNNLEEKIEDHEKVEESINENIDLNNLEEKIEEQERVQE